ncbi:hypothetical protein [Thermomonospora umbrina]|uniref:hypothetical protein n=1 Tax=Thermomonospora umbrina TaxID=111806 RepID=UPI000E2664E8|nr:hypothetical protein [Thermomonospora umbrina]
MSVRRRRRAAVHRGVLRAHGTNGSASRPGSLDPRAPIALPQIAAPAPSIAPATSAAPLQPAALRSGTSPTDGLPAPLVGVHATWLGGLLFTVTLLLARSRRRPNG